MIDSNDQRENQQSWTENVSQFYDNAISRLKVAVAIVKLHPDLLDHHIHYERDTILKKTKKNRGAHAHVSTHDACVHTHTSHI